MAAEGPLEASLRQLFPYKTDAPIKVAVTRILSRISTAWGCYEAGAVAAAFDILDFITLHRLPMPAELSDELARLAALALDADPDSPGQGAKPKLLEHRVALIKRIRFQHISAVLLDAEFFAQEDDPNPTNGVFVRARFPPSIIKEIRSQRPKASSKIMQAIDIARQRMPAFAKGPGTPEAYYQSFTEVQREDPWPGRFYLPTEETCTFLGWEDLFQAYQELGVASDAPYAGVT